MSGAAMLRMSERHRHDHDHHHEHDHRHHEHDHDHHHDRHHAGAGAPVLDIGGDVGALVARMGPDAAGTELFLRPEADPSSTVHTGVWHRLHTNSALTAAVFLELPAGTYAVLDADGTAVRTVAIVGGEVAEIDLRPGRTIE